MSFFLPDPHAKPNWRKRIIAGAILVLVFGLALGANSIWEGVRKLRAQRLRAKAEAQFHQKIYTSAVQNARASLALSPKDKIAIRVLAVALSELHQEEGLRYWNELLNSDASESDRRIMVALALRFKRLDLAEREIQKLLKQEPVSTENLRLAMAYFDLQEVPARVAACGRELARRSELDDAGKFMLARSLLKFRSINDALEGKEMLLKLSQGTNKLSSDAIRLLVDSNALDILEADDAKKIVLSNPTRGADEDFLLADLDLLVTPYRKREIVEQLIAKVRASSTPDLLTLGRWLNAHREYAATEQVLPLAEALKNQDNFLVYLDSLAVQGKWKNIDTILERQDLPLEPILQKLFQARVAKEQKEERVPELLWQQVHNLSSRDPKWLLYIAQYAEKIGETGQAIRAYRRCIADLPNSRPAFEGLIRLLEPGDDTRALRDVVKEMALRFPDDPIPRNDLAYLNLLLNEETESAKSAGISLSKTYPDYLAYKTTLALAYLRTKDFLSAKAVYNGLNVDWRTVLPGWQAVYIAVIGSSGNETEARALAKTTPLDHLKKEERLLIQPWL